MSDRETPVLLLFNVLSLSLLLFRRRHLQGREQGRLHRSARLPVHAQRRADRAQARVVRVQERQEVQNIRLRLQHRLRSTGEWSILAGASPQMRIASLHQLI